MKKRVFEAYLDWICEPVNKEEEEFGDRCSDETGNPFHFVQAKAFIAGYNIALKEIKKSIKGMEK